MQPHKLQQQSVQQPQQVSLATSQNGNIILVRGARTENGQIILQNSHELLNLFNDDEKPIILQSPRFKTKAANESTILLQSALKGTHIIDTGGNALANGSNAVLLQSAMKKSTSIPEGSIIVQQRLNKNGTSDGPILLQTLKRLDKSQSILVFRNPNVVATTTASATVTTKTPLNQRTVLTVSKEEIEDKADTLTNPPTILAKIVSSNVPLGTGE